MDAAVPGIKPGSFGIAKPCSWPLSQDRVPGEVLPECLLHKDLDEEWLRRTDGQRRAGKAMSLRNTIPSQKVKEAASEARPCEVSGTAL